MKNKRFYIRSSIAAAPDIPKVAWEISEGTPDIRLGKIKMNNLINQRSNTLNRICSQGGQMAQRLVFCED